MILEIANIEIKKGENTIFEQQLEKAQLVLNQADGYISHEFQQCLEYPEKYVLLIYWESLEAHTIGFRQSALFKEWRNLIGSFFSTTPHVEHFEKKFSGSI